MCIHFEAIQEKISDSMGPTETRDGRHVKNSGI